MAGLSSLKAAGGSHEGAGGSEAGDEVRDLTVGLLPDFVCSGAVVGAPVLVVGVLVGVEVTVGFGGRELACFADGSVGAVGGAGPDDVRTVGGEIFFSFRGDVGRHAERDGEAERGTEHGIGDAGVSAGGVKKAFRRVRAAGAADEAALEGIRHDGGGGAVLDGPAGVGPLGLAEDLDA